VNWGVLEIKIVEEMGRHTDGLRRNGKGSQIETTSEERTGDFNHRWDGWTRVRKGRGIFTEANETKSKDGEKSRGKTRIA